MSTPRLDSNPAGGISGAIAAAWLPASGNECPRYARKVGERHVAIPVVVSGQQAARESVLHSWPEEAPAGPKITVVFMKYAGHTKLQCAIDRELTIGITESPQVAFCALTPLWLTI
jgi:hypothetical protein